jgi:hypothetical protein
MLLHGLQSQLCLSIVPQNSFRYPKFSERRQFFSKTPTLRVSLFSVSMSTNVDKAGVGFLKKTAANIM